MRLYEVGGRVRDRILGRESKDVDFSCVMGPDEVSAELGPFGSMVSHLSLLGFEIFTATEQFLTVRAKAPPGFEFGGERIRGAVDVVLARRDVGGDGRHPERVELGTLEDDLARRDFTMNAIARDPEGNLIDPHGGQADIADRTIRCVGDPVTRFREDALRVLRMVRFAVTLPPDREGYGGKFFWPTPETKMASMLVRQRTGWLDRVSTERIREELHRMFSRNSLISIKMLEELELLGDVLDRGLWLKPTLETR